MKKWMTGEGSGEMARQMALASRLTKKGPAKLDNPNPKGNRRERRAAAALKRRIK